MDNKKILSSAEEVIKAVGVLKALIDRRFPPDQLVDTTLSRVVRESENLARLIKEKQ